MYGVDAADHSPPGGGGVEGARHLAHELDEEEQELWRQLRRKRDFEGRVADKRAQLSELRDRRRNVSTAHSEAVASVEYLQSELEFAREQEREIEHDIAMLKESNRILQQAFQQQQQKGGGPGALYSQNGRDARDILAEEKKRQESVQLQHEQIAHLRAHVEKLSAEKSRLHQRQQILFDKQRSAEQDRNRLLGHLQDDRSGINEVRQERIKLWEERTRMEREMAQIVREAQKGSIGKSANGVGPANAPPSSSVPGASGGVRGRVTQDTPQAFADAGGGGGGGGAAQRSSGTVPMDTAQRSHWTGFGDGSGRNSGGANGGGGGSSGFGGGFPGGTTGIGVPPSFGDLSSGLGTRGADSGFGNGGGGITEWAGTMRDFRGSASGSPDNHF